MGRIDDLGFTWNVGDEVTLIGGGPRMLVVDFGAPGQVVVAFELDGKVEEHVLNNLVLKRWR